MLSKYKAKITDRIHVRIVRYVRTHYTMVDAAPTQGMFNNYCHLNCVQWIVDHPERTNLDIVEAITVEDEMPYVHYLVLDSTLHKYLDVTLGHRTQSLEHYVIRTINRGDYYQIHKELRRSRHMWTDEHSTRFERWILGGEAVC